MSRELIAGVDANEFIKGKDKMPTLDVPAMKKFLETKGLPSATIDTLIPNIEARLKRASSFASKDIPQRILDWSMAQIRQELDGIVEKSSALVGTNLALTTGRDREEFARREGDEARALIERLAYQKKLAEGKAAEEANARLRGRGNVVLAGMQNKY